MTDYIRTIHERVKELEEDSRITKMVYSWNLTPADIKDLVLHVGDHAGAQGHTKGHKLEYGQSCPDCIRLMKRLFPDANW